VTKKKFKRLNTDFRNEREDKEIDIVVSAKTIGQKKLIISIKNNDIVICTGPAGTGKTYLSTGTALQYLFAPQSNIKKLVFMRPAKEACDEHLGALPGELSEKMSPWIKPIMDNMEEFISTSIIKNLFWEKKIEVVPLAYARGRSLNNAFIILDEAQSTTDKQLLMVLTRIGKGSKMVINGDLDQKDSVNLNGLDDAMNRLQGVQGLGIVNMDGEDIVRHPMIKEILKRYKGECQKSEHINENYNTTDFTEDLEEPQLPIRAEDLILRTA
jgi:phosphate starvation-inducible PhoH-like protein